MKKTRPRELLFLAALLLTGLILLAVVLLNRQRGAQVRVMIDGASQAVFSLDEDRTYPITTPEGTNLLEIRGGKASITQADCPDGLCVKQGAVRYVGDSIICLPHKLVIEITGEDDMALDAVSK